MHVVVATAPDGTVTLTDVVGTPAAPVVGAVLRTTPDDLPDVVRARERERPRWVWSDTATWYPPLLEAGVRVERCVDLRLCHAILRRSTLTATSALALGPSSGWDSGRRARTPGALFDLDPPADEDPLAELLTQQAAVAGADPARVGRLALLLAAESAGALVAAEMTFAGVPWSAPDHDRVLTGLLGPRPAPGFRPARLEALLVGIRDALDDADVNPDSPADLLRALRGAGLDVRSTRSWELQRVQHPVVAPLLEYKKLARLLTANGWAWLDAWVRDRRFRPTYVPGGVVTGRWASDGGGALQLPHQVRDAVRADPGRVLVVADAAQLEPRILAAMSGDTAMAAAGRAGDMYAAMVDAGAVETREQAKYGMLGAMYGGTRGESGRMLPRLTRAYPRALGLVEHAARAGERGEVVSTWLGRSSPRPGEAPPLPGAPDDGASAEEQDAARAQARGWGRFTRNFVVQGTAAEWALCWMATVRQRLHALAGPAPVATDPSGEPRLTDGPHLAFFLHDEVMVHAPAHLAEEVRTIVAESATEAGRLMFGDSGVEFPVTVAIVESYADAH